jgi:hypothetical protein
MSTFYGTLEQVCNVSNFHEALNGVTNRREQWYREDWNRPLCIELLQIPGFGDTVVMTMRTGRQGPYTPSNCDMMANDWRKLPWWDKHREM